MPIHCRFVFEMENLEFLDWDDRLLGFVDALLSKVTHVQ